MKIGTAPRHITGKHGHSLHYFQVKFDIFSGRAKSREAKAVAAYRSQIPEGDTFHAGLSEKALARMRMFG